MDNLEQKEFNFHMRNLMKRQTANLLDPARRVLQAIDKFTRRQEASTRRRGRWSEQNRENLIRNCERLLSEIQKSGDVNLLKSVPFSLRTLANRDARGRDQYVLANRLLPVARHILETWN